LRAESATTTVTVAAGVFAPGHLGELTQYLPFELVDDVLASRANPVPPTPGEACTNPWSTAKISGRGIIHGANQGAPQQSWSLIVPFPGPQRGHVGTTV
jgi:hypothetical protein